MLLCDCMPCCIELGLALRKPSDEMVADIGKHGRAF